MEEKGCSPQPQSKEAQEHVLYVHTSNTHFEMYTLYWNSHSLNLHKK